MVNQNRLLEKIWNAGVRGILFQWLKCQLTDRFQSVRMCGSESYFFHPSSGVSQDSNLGPLLFCIFINGISLELTSCKLLLYADDATLFFVIRDPRDSTLLQLEMNKFLIWASANGLNVSDNKCNFSSIARKSHTLQTSYRVGNTVLGRVDSLRDLGLTVSPRCPLMFKYLRL